MEKEINSLLERYESGKLNRRQMVGQLGTLVAAIGAGTVLGQDKPASTFEATEVNHLALRVTDVPRSRDFYKKHLGLKVSRETNNNCFMNCGNNFVALFKSDEARMDHFCFSVKDYAVLTAEEKLKAEGIKPDVLREAGRIYFPDPDGIKVQLAAETHLP